MDDVTLLSHVRIWKTGQIYNNPPRWYAEAVGCYGLTFELNVDLDGEIVSFKSDDKDIEFWIKFNCAVFVLNGVLQYQTLEELDRAIRILDRFEEVA